MNPENRVQPAPAAYVTDDVRQAVLRRLEQSRCYPEALDEFLNLPSGTTARVIAESERGG